MKIFLLTKNQFTGGETDAAVLPVRVRGGNLDELGQEEGGSGTTLNLNTL